MEKRGFDRPAKKTSSLLRLLAVLCSALFVVQYLTPWIIERYAAYSGHSSKAIVQYDGESISWEPCGELNDRPLECSTLDVPMDQFSPVNSGNKTFTLALMRLRGKTGKKNILLNPGGPGGSGLNFMYRFGTDLNTIVGEDFHLLAFDPRGVNQSFPLGSCYASAEARGQARLTAPNNPYTESGRYTARFANLAQSCYDNTGEYGQYMNTPQTAADMNSILDAVGQDSLYYWGFSYGTTLGQTYAQMFPERAERVIIDGVSDQSHWYASGSDKNDMYFGDIVDSDNVFDGFAKECIKAGSACALTSDFVDAEALKQNVTSLILSLKTDPIPVYVNASSWGELGFSQMMHAAVFFSMYKPANWAPLASALSDLLHGNGTDAFLRYGGTSLASILPGELGLFVGNNDRAPSVKQWQSTEAILDVLRALDEESVIAGSSFADDFFLEREWMYPKSHNFTPAARVETKHPLLVLSTTFDPICPLASAKGAEKTFVDSVLVEQKGYGHCTISMPSMCKAKIVKRYLQDGTMPAQGIVCDTEGVYFKEENSTVALAEMSTEDRNLVQALQNIADKFND